MKKFKITQDQLNSIIDRFVKLIYGELFKTYDEYGYIYFYLGDYPVEKKGHSREFTPYHRNAGQNLWVDDLSLLRMVKNFFNVDNEQAMGMVKDYFSTKYDIPIKYISYENYAEDGPW